MKALLIGGTGVISTSVAERLLHLNWDVTILTRGKRPLPEKMQGEMKKFLLERT